MAGVAYLFAVVAVATLADATNWCKLKSCRGELHTMCEFPSPKPSDQCADYQSASLTPAEKDELVEVHNRLRARVASGQETLGVGGGQPAGIIPPLKWDDELEQVAQRWANQCDFSHDSCRNVERFRVGQNLAISKHSQSYDAQLSEMVQGWYDEVEDFDSRVVPRFQHIPMTGHYTQLIWANSTLLGCGVVRYRADSKNGEKNFWYATYLVCNYGPSGNVLGAKMYETI